MNFGGNFLKDFKLNNSINSLQSKIKEVSQNTSWIQDIATSASSIEAALLNTPPGQASGQQQQQQLNVATGTASGGGPTTSGLKSPNMASPGRTGAMASPQASSASPISPNIRPTGVPVRQPQPTQSINRNLVSTPRAPPAPGQIRMNTPTNRPSIGQQQQQQQLPKTTQQDSDESSLFLPKKPADKSPSIGPSPQLKQPSVPQSTAGENVISARRVQPPTGTISSTTVQQHQVSFQDSKTVGITDLGSKQQSNTSVETSLQDNRSKPIPSRAPTIRQSSYRSPSPDESPEFEKNPMVSSTTTTSKKQPEEPTSQVKVTNGKQQPSIPTSTASQVVQSVLTSSSSSSVASSTPAVVPPVPIKKVPPVVPTTSTTPNTVNNTSASTKQSINNNDSQTGQKPLSQPSIPESTLSNIPASTTYSSNTSSAKTQKEVEINSKSASSATSQSSTIVKRTVTPPKPILPTVMVDNPTKPSSTNTTTMTASEILTNNQTSSSSVTSSNLASGTSSTLGPQPQVQSQIDPLQYNALVETNQALKDELQRLSLFELKCKSLEKEAKNSKLLKDANEKLEIELNQAKSKIEKELQEVEEYRSKIANLESQLREERESKLANEEERFKLLQSTYEEKLERLEEENANLKNKIIDLDRLVEEYENKYNTLKSKELALEHQNKNLENELDRLSERSSSNEMHSYKIEALQQANRVLEQELEQLKEQQRSERVTLKDKVDLLTSRHDDRIKQLEDTNQMLEQELHKMKMMDDYDKYEDSSTLNLIKSQCDSLKKRIVELEVYETTYRNLERDIDKLRQELREKDALHEHEMKKFEAESKSFNELNAGYTHLNETMLNMSRKYEQELNNYDSKLRNMQNLLDKKDSEINELKRSKDLEISNFIHKLSVANDENQNLSNQLKNMGINLNSKDEELTKIRKRQSELGVENDKLKVQLKSLETLEKDLACVTTKNLNAQLRIQELETRLDESERKYHRDLSELKSVNYQQLEEIKQLKHDIKNDATRFEKMHAEYEITRLEMNKMELSKLKCEQLEREMQEIRMTKLQRLSELEVNHKKYSDTLEKYENEIKLLNAQMINLQNEIKNKDQECKQLEKLFDTERQKTGNLIKQVDELNSLNTKLSMQNSESKRRQVSVELLTEECNTLRKNLTIATIESESRKADIAALNSQIAILDNTIKSLKDSSDKQNQLGMSYENTVYELKKKQEDYKKLQQIHETVKKEQMDTIELLEEKLRDVEKKTELQSLKHEEILLELESIRARRERLMPICPNCSAQTFPVYQSSASHLSSHHHSASHQQTQNHQQLQQTPLSAQTTQSTGLQSSLQQPPAVLLSNLYPGSTNISPMPHSNASTGNYTHQSLLQTVQQQQIQQLQQQQQQLQQQLANPLLSINIPGHQPTTTSLMTTSISPNTYLSPQIFSAVPTHLQTLQTHHMSSPFQVITLPGKQSVTVDCQTSPTVEVVHPRPSASPTYIQPTKYKRENLLMEASLSTRHYSISMTNAACQTVHSGDIPSRRSTLVDIIKINSSSQTVLSDLTRSTENKSVNTDQMAPGVVLETNNRINPTLNLSATLLSTLNTVASAASASSSQQSTPSQLLRQQMQQTSQPKVETISSSAQTLIKQFRTGFTNCNLYEEMDFLPPNVTLPKPPSPSPAQQIPPAPLVVPVISPKPICQEKSIQFDVEEILPKKPKYVLYTCKYSYDPYKNSPNENPDAELPFSAGDYIYILNENDEDGFFTGELLINARTGFVPSNFVERVSIDSSNLTRYIQSLPKHVLSNSKFNDCLIEYNLNGGQIMLAAQFLIENIQPIKPETSSVGVNTSTAPTTTIGVNTITQTTSMTSIASRQIVVAKSVQSLASGNNNIDNLSNNNTNLATDNESNTAIKIGLPYPHNLRVERLGENSILVKWDPPTAAISSLNQSIDSTDNMNHSVSQFDLNNDAQMVQGVSNVQTYNLYLNNELHSVINGGEECAAIIEEVDLSTPTRISVQAVSNKGIMSKPQECTLLLGSNRSFAPSNLTVQNLGQTSAIVSWWPSSSQFGHMISIDSIEHRNIKPGVFRFKLSGLFPDTTHLVTITALLPNHTNSEQSLQQHSASVEFRTLPGRQLAVPQDLVLEKDRNEHDAYVLSWHPVLIAPNTTSNGIMVGGYSIYIDGVRVHQILNPYASNVSLSSKLLFNGAKSLTVRTLSLDGNLESKDSEQIKLSRQMMMQLNSQTDQLNKKQPTSQPDYSNQPTIQPQSLVSNQFSTDSSLYGNTIANNQNVKKADPKQPTINQPNIRTPGGMGPIIKSTVEKPMQQQAQQFQQGIQAKKFPLMSPAKVSDAKKPGMNKINVEDELDLYENNSTSVASKPSIGPTSIGLKTPGINRPQIKQTLQPLRSESPGFLNQSQQQQQLVQKQVSNQKIDTKPPVAPAASTTKMKSEKSFKIFIALFDYDPYKMSPNQESCDEELPFKEGQLIKVYGNPDVDGYYYGECNGRSGFIPGNMISEVDDPDVIKQFINESGGEKSKKIAGKSVPSNSQHQTSSNKQKVNKNASSGSSGPSKAPGSKDQSFMPINNYSGGSRQQQNVQTMIAMYDYDPQSLSPNADTDVELPFRTGDVLTVIGEMDEDGFYMAELKGRRGLVPSNFLQPK